MAGQLTPLRWLDAPDGPAIVLLDQTRLPAEETYLTCADVPQLVDAIRRLVVRGAPLLGIAGAYGVGLAAMRGGNGAEASFVDRSGINCSIVRKLCGSNAVRCKARARRCSPSC